MLGDLEYPKSHLRRAARGARLKFLHLDMVEILSERTVPLARGVVLTGARGARLIFLHFNVLEILPQSSY